jgi:hypothetical protein
MSSEGLRRLNQPLTGRANPFRSDTQDGFCAFPTRIEISPLQCAIDDGPLLGCKPIKGCQAFTVVDDECDSFNFYWDFSHKSLRWFCFRLVVAANLGRELSISPTSYLYGSPSLVGAHSTLNVKRSAVITIVNRALNEIIQGRNTTPPLQGGHF